MIEQLVGALWTLLSVPCACFFSSSIIDPSSIETLIRISKTELRRAVRQCPAPSCLASRLLPVLRITIDAMCVCVKDINVINS